MISITDKTKCSGCSACAQACPQKCIEMQADKEGFEYPVVNLSNCIDCHICEKACQYINPFPEKDEPLHTYYYVTNDAELRESSSSGGAFTALAKGVLDADGVVFGVVFDCEWNVLLSHVENENALSELRRSKYVQAKVDNAYTLIKEYLNKGRQVLVCSTPCQINGLNHYLGKDYDNLITIDFTCHAIPSPMVWSKYLKEISKDYTVVEVNFRNKLDHGWNNYGLKVVGIKGSNQSTLVNQGTGQNAYMKGFISGLFCRPSCSNCASRNFKTKSDIMIGDFWNVEKYHSDKVLNDNKGVSLIMAMTAKGVERVNRISAYGILQEVDFNEAETHDAHHCIVKSSTNHPFRSLFFKLHSIFGIVYTINLCIEPIMFAKKIARKIIKR